MLKRGERGKEASMSLANGSRALPFGHSKEAAEDIEGLVLLEDHLQKIVVNDDQATWHGWDIESNSSEESESEGWIDVGDDTEYLHIDTEDEVDHAEVTAPPGGEIIKHTTQTSTLATTKILTPADFSLLNELRIQEAKEAVETRGGSHTKRKLMTLEANKNSDQAIQQPLNSFISELDILGPRKKVKSDYADRVASIQKGREGREKFRSNMGKVKKGVPSSSTNREKARNKPIMMILSSGAVRSKKKNSLREKQKKLRAHIERAKKARH